MNTSINYTFKFCTYKTSHSTGLYYIGKAITKNVLDGKYKGSGYRFKLALDYDDKYSWDTWETIILGTYLTEDEAYEAEGQLVPHELLADPMCLNLTAGGKKSRGKDAGALHRGKVRKEKSARAKAKADTARAKLKAMREQLNAIKENKNGSK